MLPSLTPSDSFVKSHPHPWLLLPLLFFVSLILLVCSKYYHSSRTETRWCKDKPYLIWVWDLQNHCNSEYARCSQGWNTRNCQTWQEWSNLLGAPCCMNPAACLPPASIQGLNFPFFMSVPLRQWLFEALTDITVVGFGRFAFFLNNFLHLQ